jgi:hypothetical protein
MYAVSQRILKHFIVRFGRLFVLRLLAAVAVGPGPAVAQLRLEQHGLSWRGVQSADAIGTVLCAVGLRSPIRLTSAPTAAVSDSCSRMSLPYEGTY